MRSFLQAWIFAVMVVATCAHPCIAQRVQFPSSPSGLRPITSGQYPTTGGTTMIPINPATQAGIYPSNGFGSPTFDPYAASQTQLPAAPLSLPAGTFPSGGFAGANPYPAYNGPNPAFPGTGQSATVGTFSGVDPSYSQPGMYPNSAPSALFPSPNYGGAPASGGLFGGFFSGLFGSSGNSFGGSYGQPQANYGSAWNPQGTVFNGNMSTPQFVRLFQGPRFRQSWIHGNDDSDALHIDDTDVSLAFAIPNFGFSTQPLYLLPSFGLHLWDGPKPGSTADLPGSAYSGFLDAGWQSDPARILGAELGLRVGMFSEFGVATSDSLRIMGRGIGRVRLTPRTTLKAGVMYLDRNKVKLLPAGGLLWQPNPDTRFDLFFPEPKLGHYLSTIGTMDTWWYVGGYYGGGNWTIKRANTGTTDSVDINDLRLVLGIEWGRNEQMRDGRRFGFVEVGYVFDRELLYKASPLDNTSLQDTLMVRAGFGY